MSRDHETQQVNHTERELMTWAMVLRAIIKGLLLYLVFSACYALTAPMQNGLLPTLYNSVFPGRVRFIKGDEYNVDRLLDDHIISRATSETFNIVILGSSEVWGARTLADASVVAELDALHMVASDGRPVRVYNLAYFNPYALKDLLILDAALEQGIPIDLVLLSSFDETFTYVWYGHPLVHANFAHEIHVIERNGLLSAYQFADTTQMGRSVPFFLRLWDERGALNDWLFMQTQGLKWTLARDDLTNVPAKHLQNALTLEHFQERLKLGRTNWPLTGDFFPGFQMIQRVYGVPVIILESPVPFKTNEFAPWLQAQTESSGLPLLSCWNLFHEASQFEDEFHLRTEMLPLYARILAAELSDSAMSVLKPGLPLRLPNGFAIPLESCAFFPHTSDVNQ